MPRGVRYQNREAGSALTEFAIASLIILTVMFGIIELGRCLYSYHWVSSAARLGTRYAMVRGACTIGANGCTTCSSGTLPCEAYASDVESYIQNQAIMIDTSTIGTTCDGSNNNKLNVCSVCYVAGVASGPPPCGAGKWVQVKVQYNFSFIIPLISSLVPGGSWTMTGYSERVVVQN